MSHIIKFNTSFQKQIGIASNSLECVSCAREIQLTVQDKNISTLCKTHVVATNGLHMLVSGYAINSIIKNHNTNTIEVVAATTKLLKDSSQLIKKKQQQGILSKFDYLQPLISAIELGVKAINYYHSDKNIKTND